MVPCSWRSPGPYELAHDTQPSLFGTNLLKELADSLKLAQPNLIHHLCGDHLLAGGRHWTLNFDLLLEQAIRDGSLARTIIHPHGDLRDPKTLAATLAALRAGIPNPQRERMDADLRRVTTILVVGYSGSDYFDVDPYLRNAFLERTASTPLRVIWVDHSDHAFVGQYRSVLSDRGGFPGVTRRILEYGHEAANVEPWLVLGRTDETLAALLGLDLASRFASQNELGRWHIASSLELRPDAPSAVGTVALALGLFGLAGVGLRRAVDAEVPSGEESALDFAMGRYVQAANGARCRRSTTKVETSRWYAELDREVDSKLFGKRFWSSYWLLRRNRPAPWAPEATRVRFAELELLWTRDVRGIGRQLRVEAPIEKFVRRQVVHCWEVLGRLHHCLDTSGLERVSRWWDESAAAEITGEARPDWVLPPGQRSFHQQSAELAGEVNFSRVTISDALESAIQTQAQGVDEVLLSDIEGLLNLALLCWDPPGIAKALLLIRRAHLKMPAAFREALDDRLERHTGMEANNRLFARPRLMLYLQVLNEIEWPVWFKAAMVVAYLGGRAFA